MDATEVTEMPLSIPLPAEGDGAANLHCVRVGSGRAPKLAVVLHGGPGASLDYLRPQLDALVSTDRDLFYYDQRGGGRSTLPPGWPAAGIDTHLADLDRVVDASRSASPAAKPALVGYSWGGLLALYYALRSPEKIARLLLLAPAPPWAEARERIKPNMKAAAERPEAKAFVASLDRTDRRQRFASAVVGYFFDPARALELTPFVSRERAERAAWDSVAGYDLRPELAGLAVPTLVVHGIEDPVPIDGSRELCRLSGATLVEIDHCGHCPFIEGSDVLFPAAKRFLSGA